MRRIQLCVTLIGLLGLAAPCTAQQIPPKLKVEGVPEVSDELVRRMAQYQNVRSASFGAWHPTEATSISSRSGSGFSIPEPSVPTTY